MLKALQNYMVLKNTIKFFLLLFVSFSCSNNNNINYIDGREIKKESIVVGDDKFDGPEKFMYYHAAVKHGNDDISKPSIYEQYKPGYKQIELRKAFSNLKNNRFTNQSRTGVDQFSTYAKDNATFIERGPYNVPGRTRGLIVDAADPSGNTWIAGSVGGGLWKTINEGLTWNNITRDMENIAISWIAQSPSKPNTIYVGTGESWVGSLGDIDGAGIYKSTDGGDSWVNISPKDNQGYIDEKFTNISRIIVDPNNSDIVVMSTEGSNQSGSRIYKSTNGGQDWVEKYSSNNTIQQVIESPVDFNIQYAAVNGVGVLRSVDGGSTWTNPGGIGLSTTVSYDDPDGIIGASGGTFGRLELAVSYQNKNTLYAGIDGNSESFLKVSYDGGTTWNLLRNDDGTSDDWLMSIGWYANTLTLNPFNDSIVYYGSQDAEKAKVLPDAGISSSGSTTKVTLNNTSSHLDLVNIWGGSALGSGTEWTDNSESPDFVNIEIRFGPGKKQKAYRFSVPDGSGSGVSHTNYSYQNVVEVPFQVWNTSSDPEEQLTVSFRDNNNDGSFNLESDYLESREYIFPQIIKYDPTMSQQEINGDGTPSNSASAFGQLYKSLYLVWPYLSSGSSWNPDNLPESSIKIELVDANYKTLKKSPQLVTNYYGNGGDANVNNNVHVDHHQFGTIIDSKEDSTFRVFLTTDGGVYNSVSNKDPGGVNGDFEQSGVTGNTWFTPAGGYNTTQFYGADKIVGVDKYFGGAQDNGTFASLQDANTSSTTNYEYLIGGDGFEVVAHHTDPDKLFGGSQGANFWYSHDGGQNWNSVANKLVGNGGFISRVSSSYQLTDLLVTVSDAGVNISEDFGVSWQHTQISGAWGFWSGTDVEVSMANPRYIWAGGRMSSTGNIFLSKDYGETFEAVNNFANVGITTGLYSHPTEDSTAYVLFGYKNYSKIIETKDLGQTWNDISGFNGNSTSSNGFPNVAVYSFLVMPHDTNIMWAGTEIGLFESTNKGETWHKVEGDLPNVTIWDMKIKDQGQVVIATHGRGIWTATIDDLKDFVPNPTTLPPVILEAAQADKEDVYEINLKVNLISVYDSIDIIANEKQRGRFFDTDNIGDRDYVIGVDDFGDFELKAIGYQNGLQYPSKIYNVIVNPVLAATTEYSTNFSDLVGDEFYLDRFRIGTQGGFEGRQLHTEHPYMSGVAGGYDDGYSLIAMLNIPIIVTDFTPSIRFNEIAIVETGQAGTSYGDYGYWDYVIIEASKDGVYWKELIDGYDSDAYGDWKAAYTSGSFGSPDLIKDRQINFQPHFNEGDTVKVRFRLFSDDATVGWGWMVDDLYIQKETPVVQGIEYTKLDDNISIYPNPTDGRFNLKFSDTWAGEVNCQIIDIFGRSIYSNSLNNDLGSSSHDIDISSENDGMYILQLVQGEKKTMFKLIKE